MPDFWLHEAANVMWQQVRRRVYTSAEARKGLALLRTHVPPTPTKQMELHDAALAIASAVNHCTYDTMYVAFAVAVQAAAVIVSDGPFVRAMQTHPNAAMAAMVVPLDAWASSKGVVP
jgi:predicted nucleic acid-binding protein